MTLRINDNSAQFFVSAQLQKSYQTLTSSLEKLSSGQRINRAADDASGMVIADSLGSQVRGIGQAIRNAGDTIAMSQIAGGALDQSAELIGSIRVKAIQAASGAQTTETRKALQADINKALTQLDNIAQTTSYNGQKLLSGVFTDKTFQVGPNSGETATLSIGSATTNTLGSNEKGQLSEINVLTAEGAQNAISIADAALSQVNEMRSDIGSMQNQVTATINNLATTGINLASAQSTVADLDFAEEIHNFNRMKVLEQVGVFAMTQAGNVNKQSVFNLLQG